jgi:HD-GYP domain-containing protein (c-di-GMP phosphodiesterase class II)/sensor domain CHASE-containing protein
MQSKEETHERSYATQLRHKTLLLNIGAVACLLLTLYVISSNILLQGFAKLEDQDIRQDAERATKATNALLATLDSKAGDWANWDDSYAFVVDQNPAFLSDNAGDKTFAELHINLLAFARMTGRIIFAREYDLQYDVTLPLSPVFQQSLPSNHPFLSPSDISGGKTGILMLPRGPLLVAAKPVLTSQGKGPVRGVLMMGRYFDESVIKQLADQTSESLSIESFDDPELPADFSPARAAIAQRGGVFVQSLSDETIAGYTVMKDIYDRPALLLRVEMPRVIHAQGQVTARYLFISLLIIGIIFGVAAQLLASKWINALAARQNEVRSLALINEITHSAASSLDFRGTMQMLADELGKLISADGCYITQWDPAKQRTIPSAAYGKLRDSYPQRESSEGERTMTESVLQAGHPLIAEDVFNSPYLSPEIAKKYPTRSLLGLPLIVEDQELGAALIGFNHSHHFTPEEVARAEQASGPVALAIAKARLFEDLKQSHAALEEAYDSTLEGWARALELRDRETEGHSRRVTEMTIRLACVLGVAEKEITPIRRGALLHDIGKVGVPDHILLKPGPLTPEEWVIMRQHPIYAVNLLAPIDYLQPALDIPYCHHEKWNGTGYPRGLEGEAIPLAARMFAIVDVWDALSSDRPYRAALGPYQVVEFIASQREKHFDPAIVEAFIPLLDLRVPEPPEPI